MKCLGRTKTLKRCNLNTRFLLCRFHWWQVFPTIVAAAGIWSQVIIPIYSGCFPFTAELPEFRITTIGLDLPSQHEKLSIFDIQERRRNILEIHNPNKVPLSGMRFYVQFPEAIISMKAAKTSMCYQVNAIENWAEQEMAAEGLPDSFHIESFADEEKTGLWELEINTVPANSMIEINILTTVGPEGNIYVSFMTRTDSAKADDELLWILYGQYQYLRGSEIVAENFVIPLNYERQNRILTALAPRKGTLDDFNYIRVLQGRGICIPGIMATRGSFFSKPHRAVP